jgi:DNA sulfur modification protein DndD
LAQLNKELSILESQQKDWQNELDNLDPENSMVKVYRDVHRTLELVNRAFLAAQKDNLRRFLGDLQERANSYLERLSANDFHGEIHLVQTANDSTEIRLFSSNGTEIRNPSGSQKTVMYISVLFAISDFTKDKRDEDYPLIFDAATSSFGESKEADFYNVISGIEKQCIIVTKDFLDSNENVQESLIDTLNCSVYRIKKSSDTDKDKTDLSKVRTEIKKLK